MAKRKQDLHLDNIEKGLSTLKGIGEAMGETLKTQDVLIDTIDTKVATVPAFDFHTHTFAVFMQITSHQGRTQEWRHTWYLVVWHLTQLFECRWTT